MVYVIYKAGNKYYVESSNGCSIETQEYDSFADALISLTIPAEPHMLYAVIPQCDNYLVTPLSEIVNHAK